MRILFAAVATAGLLVAGTAFADDIEDRKAMMKKNGAAMGVLVKTVKGEMAYDADAVLAAFTSMREETDGFADHFPEGSETGGDTIASPKIWEDMEGFKAALSEFHSDLDAAIEAKPANMEEFQPVFGQVAENCQACHKEYRVQKN